MDPRKDCELALDDHSQEMRIDRGLPFVDLERMVHEGNWRPQPDGTFKVKFGKWTIPVKMGRCLITVLTVEPDR
jgi:hypothetical protein